MNRILLKWSTIEKLGNSKIAKSSYYWFFIIPILAKLFQNIPRTVIVSNDIFIDSITNVPMELNLAFPFKWYLLFIIGIFFIISNIIYQISCPHIIREFRNYAEFVSSGYPNSYLLAQADFHNVPENAINVFTRSIPIREGFDSNIKMPLDEKEYHYKIAQREYFDTIYNIANASKIGVRLLATLIIILAFVLLSIIIFQNIFTVIEIYNAS